MLRTAILPSPPVANTTERSGGYTYIAASASGFLTRQFISCGGIILLCFFGITGLYAQVPQKGISVHDPVIAKQDSIYYIFCTGRGINCWSSTDMLDWKKEKAVFSVAPQWTDSIVPGFKNHIWAPDIFYYNNRYYLFYSVSAFGKNTSAIGVAVNKTLHPFAADYRWEDKGIVIRSIPGKTNFNAIDPNIIVVNAQPHLSFGSFWKGIMLVKLSDDLLRVADGEEIMNIASRKTFSKDTLLMKGSGNAIEAPYIFRKGKYYYLFASIDFCCKGKESTYKVIVGRSESIEGSYKDQDGKLLLQGGGTIVIKGNDEWYAAGHNVVATFEGQDYIVFHGYDAADNGKPKLQIKKLSWDKKGWPSIK